MARYNCPVCGRNHENLQSLKACIGVHIDNENKEREKQDKIRRIIDLKQNAINKKCEELRTLIKEFNEIADNPYMITYTPPLTQQKIKPAKKDTNVNGDIKANTNKKDAGDKKEKDFDQMLNDLYGRAKKSNTFSKEEAEKFEKDLDDCLKTLLGSLLIS